MNKKIHVKFWDIDKEEYVEAGRCLLDSHGICYRWEWMGAHDLEMEAIEDSKLEPHFYMRRERIG